MMRRENTASLRIGGAIAVLVLVFWSIWYTVAGSVPVISTLAIIPMRIDLPVLDIAGVSLWSRWLDVPCAYLLATFIAQIWMRYPSDKVGLGAYAFPFAGFAVGLVNGLITAPFLAGVVGMLLGFIIAALNSLISGNKGLTITLEVGLGMSLGLAVGSALGTFMIAGGVAGLLVGLATGLLGVLCFGLAAFIVYGLTAAVVWFTHLPPCRKLGYWLAARNGTNW